MDINTLLAPFDTELIKPTAISALAVDSRQCEPGSLFLAYPGSQSDGRAHIASAIEQGAVACAYDPEDFDPPALAVPLIPIKQLGQTVSLLGDIFYGHPSRDMRIFGVTGTNGKTTITHALAQAFSHLQKKTGVIGTLGQGELGNLHHTGLTTPDPASLQSALASQRADDITHVAIELSSHALDQRRAAAVSLDVAITTAVTQDHLDYHHDFSHYIAAKERILRFESLDYAVIFADDAIGQSWIERYHSKRPIISYGFNKPTHMLPHIHCDSMHIDPSSNTRHLHIDTPWGVLDTHTSLIGDYNVLNLMAVIATLGREGIALSDIASVIPKIQAPPGRVQTIRTPGRPTVIIDYAHTPDALYAVLKAVKPFCQGDLLCVFGCGGDRDRDKRPLMGQAAAKWADRIWLTNDNPRYEKPDAILADIKTGCEHHPKLTVIADRATAIEDALANGQEHDTIVIAGKGHECYQQIADQQLPFSDHACVTDYFKD